ncbi:hypothetical protein INT46_008941 [Mucor plumbeus]|uniref:BZIP domain-containing protein n=1 Tax=Mucor plumbeus TaxID=97098 RepID=A0A8H7V4L3_9FUNG|nr:hypothetical protein INT46_008941 [Mucor plumbeus]
MSVSNKNNTVTAPAWGLDNNTLDDWLENDLKQSSLFQCRKAKSTTSVQNNNHDTQNNSDNTNSNQNNSIMKCSLKNLLVHEPKAKEEDKKEQHENKSNVDKQLPQHLIPIIKVYSLLNTIRQKDQLAKEMQYNRKRLYATPPPPSPVLSTTSDFNCKSDNKNNIITKKKRGNNRPAADMMVKRQRNTDAARRSRLRKAIRMETLEKRVDVLKTDNERLRVTVAVLETEVNHVTEKEQRNRQRVLELEAQLAIAHKQLVKEYK